jgi:putative flavoprotein involved in K+ transport
MDIGLGALYSERAVANGMTTEKADLIFASPALPIMHDFQIPLYDRCAKRDADFYARHLRRLPASARLGRRRLRPVHEVPAPRLGLLHRRRRIDLIIDGSIKLVLRSGGPPDGDSVVLPTAPSCRPIVVVYATGFGSMNGWAADLIDQDVADKVGKGLGPRLGHLKDPGPWEGEQRNMWKPTQQEALWFHGGNLHQSRHYSQYLSLQLKARYEGI